MKTSRVGFVLVVAVMQASWAAQKVDVEKYIVERRR